MLFVLLRSEGTNFYTITLELSQTGGGDVGLSLKRAGEACRVGAGEGRIRFGLQDAADDIVRSLHLSASKARDSP